VTHINAMSGGIFLATKSWDSHHVMVTFLQQGQMNNHHFRPKLHFLLELAKSACMLTFKKKEHHATFSVKGIEVLLGFEINPDPISTLTGGQL